MGESTEELNRDIEESRNRLGSHLDELQDKVSPAAIATRKKEAAKSRLVGVREKAMGTARSAGDKASGSGSAVTGAVTDKVSGTASGAADTAKEQFQGAPLAAGVAAFGLGMVIAALVPSSRAEQKAAVQVKDTVQEQAQPLVADAKQAAADVGQNLKGEATDAAQQVMETGSDAAANVQDEARSSADTVRNQAT